jgi:glyceraldehyde-3-phosphate dehydrogenase (NADP+)
MTKKYGLLIDGRHVDGASSMTVVNPFDAGAVAEVSLAGAGEMAAAAAAAARAFGTWRTVPTYERVHVLRRIVAGIEERREELAGVIVAEAGKPLALSRGEVARAVNTFTLAAEEAGRMGGELLPLDLQPDAAGRLGITARFPRGPMAAVAPFNFPLNLVAHKVAPALASGNTVVLKPASKTPVASLILGEIASEAGLPPGVLNVVPAPAETAALLLEDSRIRMISFTGSAAVGWGIRSRAGTRKVLLELGGNAAAVIEPDADLGFAARRCALGSFAYSGQICISVQHVLVARSVADEFRALFVRAVEELATGDPRDEKTVVGPMISEQEAVRVEEWVGEALAAGAKLLTGGSRKGSFFEPTVLEGTDASMKIGCREVFGPVATLDTYDDFAEALKRVNSSVYGLQAGVFTRDTSRVFEAFRELEVGGVIINDYPTFRVDHMPYGGVKESGLGREGVRYSMEEMTEQRLLVLNLSDPG